MNIMPLILFGIIFIILIAGIVLLQILLSKGENKWLGFILPAAFFLFSLFGVLGIAAFTSMSTQMQSVSENGEIIRNTVETVSQKTDVVSLIGIAASTLFLYNIPTVILLLIYAACREKRKRNLRLDKMKIQDLE